MPSWFAYGRDTISVALAAVIGSARVIIGGTVCGKRSRFEVTDGLEWSLLAAYEQALAQVRRERRRASWAWSSAALSAGSGARLTGFDVDDGVM